MVIVPHRQSSQHTGISAAVICDIECEHIGESIFEIIVAAGIDLTMKHFSNLPEEPEAKRGIEGLCRSGILCRQNCERIPFRSEVLFHKYPWWNGQMKQHTFGLFLWAVHTVSPICGLLELLEEAFDQLITNMLKAIAFIIIVIILPIVLLRFLRADLQQTTANTKKQQPKTKKSKKSNAGDKPKKKKSKNANKQEQQPQQRQQQGDGGSETENTSVGGKVAEVDIGGSSSGDNTEKKIKKDTGSDTNNVKSDYSEGSEKSYVHTREDETEEEVLENELEDDSEFMEVSIHRRKGSPKAAKVRNFNLTSSGSQKSSSPRSADEPLSKTQKKNMARAAKLKEEAKLKAEIQEVRLSQHKKELEQERLKELLKQNPSNKQTSTASSSWNSNNSKTGSKASLDEEGHLVWD
ncbi:11161_t:CDS:2 [Ambispora gerdemannii]|uniref:11161_t:CDS:1 n=1 Tax=Ambispora gerdemannii TaxID=144530 RepID=A0A9N8VCU4_9GLOM|nr:11161_t:CDS:2 [Ambispora gerdemannii]